MRVAFRADASVEIGTGHVMRSLTLADVLKSRLVRTRFISRWLPDHLRALLMQKGHEVVLLETPTGTAKVDGLEHSSWLGVSQEQDAADALRVLKDGRWDWVVVDHYALDFRWESKLREVAGNILAIDDIADRRHDCDILLDQNFYADMEGRYATRVPERCQMLLGPRYALLRDEFREMRDKVRPREGAVRRILVFFGGVDAENYTARTIAALSELNLAGIQVDTVIGAQHPHREKIETECAKWGYACHVQTTRMAELMAAADLAIGAGGATTWERCALGLPAVVVSVAENQISIAQGAERSGVHVYLGNADEVTAEMLAVQLKSLLVHPEKLVAMSEAGLQLVDASGSARVAEHVLGEV